jgi:hypothetical protein
VRLDSTARIARARERADESRARSADAHDRAAGVEVHAAEFFAARGLPEEASRHSAAARRHCAGARADRSPRESGTVI